CSRVGVGSGPNRLDVW
nr:immunoglobulin heavy chain junction region [Macaca mulatta]MOV36427.1 immunoglobulin heavy chain junction region [Macaca mulatta]